MTRARAVRRGVVDFRRVAVESVGVPFETCDVLGASHRFDHPPRRVVSLVPSITETLFDLGAGDSVVGITDWCIFPEGLALPRVGGTKNPRVDEIRALEPDLVHMNLEENLKKHAEAIETFAPVFVTEPKSPRDVLTLLGELGRIHGCERAAEIFSNELEKELSRPAIGPFTFVCPIWKSPWMWCGGDTYVSKLVESVGGRNLLGGRDRYPSIDLDGVLELKPDVIFLPDEPFEFTGEDAREVARRFDGRVVGPFPGHLFTWHGTRTIVGLRGLRERLSGTSQRRGGAREE